MPRFLSRAAGCGLSWRSKTHSTWRIAWPSEQLPAAHIGDHLVLGASALRPEVEMGRRRAATVHLEAGSNWATVMEELELNLLFLGTDLPAIALRPGSPVEWETGVHARMLKDRVNLEIAQPSDYTHGWSCPWSLREQVNRMLGDTFSLGNIPLYCDQLPCFAGYVVSRLFDTWMA